MTEPTTPHTVIEAFLSLVGSIDLSILYSEVNAVGISDQTLRLAIRRLSAGGKVEQRGRGRAGSLMMTRAEHARQTRDRIGLSLGLRTGLRENPLGRNVAPRRDQCSRA
jgi:phenylacetic acid degradation operon negative regulatory protein